MVGRAIDKDYRGSTADAAWRGRQEPAMQLLLACLAPAESACPTPPLAPDDWPRLLHAIDRHRVPGLAWRGLRRLGMDPAPAAIRGELEGRAQANVAYSLMLLRESLLLLDAFHRAGIAALPLKGPILSQQLHGDPGLRQSNDIDLLIDAAQLPRAQAVVREAGFVREKPARELDTHSWRLFQRAYHHAQYRRPDGPLLELHWRLHPLASLHPADVHELLTRSDTITVGDQRVPVLSSPEQLLYLAGHGARHEWMRLKWVCDLPPLLGRMDAAQRHALQRRARLLGLQRPLAQALRLCTLLFDLSLPADLAHAARTDGASRAMLRRAQAAIRRPEPSGRPGEARTPLGYWTALRRQLRLKKRLRYKLECLGRVLFSPADIETMRLPPALGFLYVFLRPLFWLRRRLRGI